MPPPPQANNVAIRQIVVQIAAILTEVSLFYLFRLENTEVGDIRNGDQDLRTWVDAEVFTDSEKLSHFTESTHHGTSLHQLADYVSTVNDRAGSSTFTLPPFTAGFWNSCGFTRCGASKPFTALRSSPVRVHEFTTRLGGLSSHAISTWRAFERSRFKMNIEVSPVCGFTVPEASRYGTASMPWTSYVGACTTTSSTLPLAYCSAQL